MITKKTDMRKILFAEGLEFIAKYSMGVEANSTVTFRRERDKELN